VILCYKNYYKNYY